MLRGEADHPIRPPTGSARRGIWTSIRSPGSGPIWNPVAPCNSTRSRPSCRWIGGITWRRDRAPPALARERKSAPEVRSPSPLGSGEAGDRGPARHAQGRARRPTRQRVSAGRGHTRPGDRQAAAVELGDAAPLEGTRSVRHPCPAVGAAARRARVGAARADARAGAPGPATSSTGRPALPTGSSMRATSPS